MVRGRTTVAEKGVLMMTRRSGSTCWHIGRVMGKIIATAGSTRRGGAHLGPRAPDRAIPAGLTAAFVR